MALAKPLLTRSIVLPATRCFSAAGTTGRVQGTKNATFATATGTVNEGTPPPENFAAKVRKVIPLYIISHSSNIVRGIGLVMPDMLILQSCMFFASTTNAAFNLLQPKPLYTPAIYGLLFALVSATIVAKILKERFVWLDPEEEAIFNEHFKEFMPMPKFKKLIDHGTKHPTWSEDALASSTVIAPGKPANLVLLVAGKANVNAHDAAQANVTTIERGPGILGEKGFLRGKTGNADVVMAPGSKYIVWEEAHLRNLLAEDAQLKRAIDNMIGHALSGKLSQTTWELADAQNQIADVCGELEVAEHEDALLHIALGLVLRHGRRTPVKTFYDEATAYCSTHKISEETKTAVLRRLGIEKPAEMSDLGELCERMASVAAPHHVHTWKRKRSVAEFVIVKGMRVNHPERGPGVVIDVQPNDRKKPVNVLFDNGQTHQYSYESSNLKFLSGGLSRSQSAVSSGEAKAA